MPVIKVKSEEVKIKVPITTLRIEPTTQAKTVEPTIEEQLITPDEGVFALSSVTVNPVTSEIDENIKAENIKEGVSILGVDGTIIEADSNMVKLNEYFEEVIPVGDFISTYFEGSGLAKTIKKFPSFRIEGTDATRMFMRFPYDYDMLPEIDTSHIETFKETFKYSSSLTRAPKLNMTSAKDATSMYESCGYLTNIDDVDLSNITNADSMFARTAITKVDRTDTGQIKNMRCMFYYDSKLEEIVNLDTSSTTVVSQILDGCNVLKRCVEIDCGGSTQLTSMISSPVLEDFGGFKNAGMAYLTSSNANNISYRINVSKCVALTHDSLMNIINKLYDIASLGVKTQMLILGEVNLAKLTDEEIAIATGKGWTVS